MSRSDDFPSEQSHLLATHNPSGDRGRQWKRFVFIAIAAFVLTVFVILSSSNRPAEVLDNETTLESALDGPYPFPSDFVWGTATSSYQIEGAVNEGGRGPSIWDAFCKENDTIVDGSDGSTACDHYHRFKEDVLLMKHLNVQAYRFSIAWPRIIPDGRGDVNQEGIAFYSELIDILLEHDIEPWVTLFHWDLPLAIYEKYGGWMNQSYTVDAFGEYARVCFQAFGDRVRHWITINEPWTVAVNGHGVGVHAPGHYSNSEPYIVGHNMILAHATAARIYKNEFANLQKGMVGLSNSGDHRYPLSVDDVDAAERAELFQLGWFTDPFFFGDYPTVMRERLGNRLPKFSAKEKDLLIQTPDFIGLNYYSSLLASTPVKEATWEGYWADCNVDFSMHDTWQTNAMGWPSVPDGLREMLLWMSERYSRPLIFVTENGSAEEESNVFVAKNDEKRRSFFESHLRSCGQALEHGVRLGGYFLWSLMDNFEWQFGYQRRFGMCYVDFETLERTPKASALWYSKVIQSRGLSVPRMPEISWDPPGLNFNKAAR